MFLRVVYYICQKTICKPGFRHPSPPILALYRPKRRAPPTFGDPVPCRGINIVGKFWQSGSAAGFCNQIVTIFRCRNAGFGVC
ncbi:hypothetical protein SUBVAR_06897 [Subdoligranulum variabile DSM 15176]|uniref:Uncharacterized protein n=1 Tax=Subdoligranulum variabile DSM 15176 TaxID=411471 RepID=D1PR69_9FIRM|nr:hypothetical protein SUBVAR_06897 [Subdoligranulum variabile DSM 15176]